MKKYNLKNQIPLRRFKRYKISKSVVCRENGSAFVGKLDTPSFWTRLNNDPENIHEIDNKLTDYLTLEIE